MEIPVPSDWDGETFKCVEVQWPDSAEWFAILSGLITSMARGYTWRVFSKAENDAIKAIGRDIVYRNLPYRDCCTNGDNGDSPGGDLPPYAVGSGGCGDCDDCEDDYMPGITWLEWDDGDLYMYFGPCCRVLVEGEMNPGSSTPPDDPISDPPETPPSYACRRAWYMADTLIQVADKVVDVGDDIIPWPGAVMAAFPYIRFDVAYLTSALLKVGPVDVANDWQESDREYYRQVFACKFAPILNDDLNALTTTQWQAMLTVVGSAFGSEINLMLLDTIRAIGQGDLSDAGIAGAFDDTVDCECPPDTGGGDVGDVVWSGSVTVTREDGTYTLLRRFNGGLSSEHEFITDTGNFKAVTFNHALDISPGTELDDLLLAIEPVVPSNELLHTEWHTADCGHIDEDSLHGKLSDTDLIGRTITYTNGYVWLNESWSSPKTSLSWQTGEARSCPQEQTTNKIYRWYVHIARVNGVATGVVPIPGGI